MGNYSIYYSIGLGVVIFILVIAIIKKSIQKVPQSRVVIIERFGKYHKTLKSGINFVFPFIDHPKKVSFQMRSQSVESDKYENKNGYFVDIREQMLDYEPQAVITKDNVTVNVDPVLYFQIVDAAKAVYEVVNFPNAIEQITKTALRNTIGALELDEVLSAREAMNEKLRTVLDEATDKWGVKVTRVELQEIELPPDLKDDLEKQMKAERERRAKVLEAEGLKQKQILESEGEKISKLNVAEAERQAILMKAEAEAKAIELNRAAFANDKDFGKYMIAIKYVEALSQMTSGKDNKVIYMPYEATGIISSLSGMKELFDKKK